VRLLRDASWKPYSWRIPPLFAGIVAGSGGARRCHAVGNGRPGRSRYSLALFLSSPVPAWAQERQGTRVRPIHSSRSRSSVRKARVCMPVQGIPRGQYPILCRTRWGCSGRDQATTRRHSSAPGISTRTGRSGPIRVTRPLQFPVGLEQIWGAYEVPLIGSDPPRTAAWGFCDRDYPRQQIVSPYSFRTAKAHYAALLADARRRGGPTRLCARCPCGLGTASTCATSPRHATWYYGAILQIPTYLSAAHSPSARSASCKQNMYPLLLATSSPRVARPVLLGRKGSCGRFAQYGGKSHPPGRLHYLLTWFPGHAQCGQDPGHADPHGQHIQ
jgi:hypothetical protein